MSALNPASISVIIPTYNQWHLLQETLDSVFAQTVPVKEVIVVDDGSTDETRLRLAGDQRIVYLRQSNLGSSAARNAGLAVSTGDLVLSLDHDDLMQPDYVKQIVETFQQFPKAGAAWFNFSIFGDLPVANFLRSTSGYCDPLGFAKAVTRACHGGTAPMTLSTTETLRLLSNYGPQSNSAIVYRRDVLAGWLSRITRMDDFGAALESWARSPFQLALVDVVCWQKRVAGHNTSRQIGQVIVNHHREEAEWMLRRFEAQLPRFAMNFFRRYHAEKLLERGYHQSRTGDFHGALSSYYQSLRSHLHLRPVVWMFRAMARHLASRFSPRP